MNRSGVLLSRWKKKLMLAHPRNEKKCTHFFRVKDLFTTQPREHHTQNRKLPSYPNAWWWFVCFSLDQRRNLALPWKEWAEFSHECVAILKKKERIGTSNASLSTISSTFNSLFKVLCIFPSRYLCAIGLSPVFSFRWNLPPSFGLHSQTTRLTEGINTLSLHTIRLSELPRWTMNGIVTLHDASFQRTLVQSIVQVDVFFPRLQFGSELCDVRAHPSPAKKRNMHWRGFRF